jgi:serum/glucocorticoid-regulated kinase 2
LNNKRNVTISDFNEIAPIGRGATGSVILASDKLTDELFAIKIIPKSMLRNEKCLNRALFERDVLMKIQHPFVTKLYRTFQSKNCLYYVLEYVGGGDLFFHLHREVSFSPYQIKLYACEIVLALLHIHKLGIIYRDLKPENILIGTDGHIKLADFGLAKEMQSKRCTSMCGTKEYLSPEIIAGKKYDTKSDWWAFGIVIYRLLANRMPFSNESTPRLFELIQNGRVRFTSIIDPDAKNLLTKLLQTDPTKRIGDDDIMHQPYFKDIDWNKVAEKGYEPCFVPEMASPDSTENFPTDRSNFGISEFEKSSFGDDSSDDILYQFGEQKKLMNSAPLMYINDFSCTNLCGLDSA